MKSVTIKVILTVMLAFIAFALTNIYSLQNNYGLAYICGSLVSIGLGILISIFIDDCFKVILKDERNKETK